MNDVLGFKYEFWTIGLFCWYNCCWIW